MLVQVPGSTQYQVPVPENLFYLLTRTDRTVHCTLVVYPYYLRIHSVIQKSFTGTCNPCCSPAVSVHMYLALCTGTCTGTIFCADLLLLTTVLLSILHTTVTLITFFSQNSTCTYTLQTVTILKISGKMRPTWCFQMNHSKHNIMYNFLHWQVKNT